MIKLSGSIGLLNYLLFVSCKKFAGPRIMVLCPDLTEVAKCGKIQMLRRKDISSK